MSDDNRLYFSDSTLGDGQQTRGVDSRVAYTVGIAWALDEIGIDYIDASINVLSDCLSCKLVEDGVSAVDS
jgi:isopropylmalate/homocitrate/citramalate synthase